MCVCIEELFTYMKRLCRSIYFATVVNCDRNLDVKMFHVEDAGLLIVAVVVVVNFVVEQHLTVVVDNVMAD